MLYLSEVIFPPYGRIKGSANNIGEEEIRKILF
jgi:hypothetical protein